MKTQKLLIIIFASIVIAAQLYLLSDTDLSWSFNAGIYLGIAAMVLLIVSVIYGHIVEKKQAKHP
jgi:hypothetical protein